ncbi:MAG: hypothetical protein LBB88_12150 [Planctomycetaceae bacterium]|nr:hypothetical protein [Planctomycetaceae bacterium]
MGEEIRNSECGIRNFFYQLMIILEEDNFNIINYSCKWRYIFGSYNSCYALATPDLVGDLSRRSPTCLEQQVRNMSY